MSRTIKLKTSDEFKGIGGTLLIPSERSQNANPVDYYHPEANEVLEEFKAKHSIGKPYFEDLDLVVGRRQGVSLYTLENLGGMNVITEINPGTQNGYTGTQTLVFHGIPALDTLADQLSEKYKALKNVEVIE